MIITYYGLSCFKIQSGDTTLVFDLPASPKTASRGGPSKKSNIKPPRFHADIALESHDHSGHNGAKGLPAGEAGLSEEKQTFLIDSPGEYEVKGVHIQGFKTYHDNTVYVVQLENIKLCFLGDYGEKELRPELKEGIDKIDILFAPIGGETVLEPEASRNLANQLEPGIVIPTHYTVHGKKDMLKIFLAEMGQKDVKPIEKLSIKKKEISENGTRVVVLEKQGA